MTTKTKKVTHKHLSIGQRIDLIRELQDVAELPWDIKRIFPEFRIYGNELVFSSTGDFVSKEETILALELLLKELKS